jgi:hypothetical protein
VDEITDSCGRYIAKMLLGKLNKDELRTQLLGTNYSTIAVLWPEGGIEDKFHVPSSDPAACMLKVL